MKLVIATHNKDKEKEIAKAFHPFNMTLESLQNYKEIGEIVEDGLTLKDNAFIKSRTAFNYTKVANIGDDTGLEVDALNGAPGIFSSRYAGENCTYDDNVNKLLDSMKNIPFKDRTARFKTVMTFTDGKRELFSEGVVEGIIANERKGLDGFGYDPLFYIPELGKTFAELTMDEKQKISHRGLAIKKMIDKLLSYNIIKSSIKEVTPTR